MGRELKRVSLDFDWPLNEVWKGFINPHYKVCSTCGGNGATSARKRLEDLISLLMLSGHEADSGKCHPYFQDAPLHHTAGIVCSPDMVELTTALADRAPDKRFGHDSSDGWHAVAKIIKAAGLPEKWGYCKDCDGEGVDKTCLKADNEWEPTEPPAGEGYQIWETVSEGSPISPVFATPGELAHYMAKAESGVTTGISYDNWFKFITGPGWALTFIAVNGTMKTGVEAVGD